MPSKSARKRQSRLEFTPLPSSSPAARVYHQQIRDRAAAVTIEGSPSTAKRRKFNTASLASGNVDQASINDAMPTPAATAHGDRDGSEDELAAETSISAKASQKRRRQRQQQLDFSNNRDADTFDVPSNLPSSSRARSRSSKVGVFSSSAQPKMVELSSSDESDVVPRSSRKAKSGESKELKRKTRSSQRPVVLDDSNDEAGITFNKPQPVQEDSDDDDDMPTTQGKQARTRRKRISKSSFVEDSSPPRTTATSDSDSDSDVIEISSLRKRRRQNSEGVSGEKEDDDNDDEEEGRNTAPKTPGRLAKRPRMLSRQEKEDLEEDLGFLGPSSDAESETRPSTQSAQKSARQKALEKLKAKRGKGLTQVAEEEEKDDEDEGARQEEEEIVDLLSDDANSVSAPPMSSRQMFAVDENDEGFLVEEEEESTLGVPDGIPLAFTRYASMKPKELFRYAVDWMVQKHINPGFNMDDEIYELTFKKLDDEVRGLAGSKFESSAWTPEFTIALKARHHIAYHRLDRIGEHWGRDKCDACNRSGHPATYEVQFHGKPYYRETLEDVDESDSDSDDEVDPDPATYDAQSREVLPESTSFYLGKFCMSNAITAHALNHWRYHLRQAVDHWLEISGYNMPQKLVERSKLSTRKLRKMANKIVEKMEEAGEVSVLWKAFREKIDIARNSKQGRYRLGGDSP